MSQTEEKVWWCLQPYHPNPIKQKGSHDEKTCLVTVAYCVDFCWGPTEFFFGTEVEANRLHQEAKTKAKIEAEKKKNGI